MVLSPSQMSTSLNEEYFSNNPKLLELVKEHNSYVWGNRANAHLSLITQLQMNKAIPEFYAQEELHAILNKCFDIEKKAALEKFGLFTQQELSWRKLFWHDLKPDLKKFGNIFAIASVLSLPIIGSYYGLLVLSKVILGATFSAALLSSGMALGISLVISLPLVVIIAAILVLSSAISSYRVAQIKKEINKIEVPEYINNPIKLSKPNPEPDDPDGAQPGAMNTSGLFFAPKKKQIQGEMNQEEDILIKPPR